MGNKPLTVLSLFDGISCGRVALERADISVKAYYASEIDKYAISISRKNHPDIVHLGDITQWRTWDIPVPDLILAGSPCQGFSFAGKQLAFEDYRSKLFFDFVEILGIYNPRYFLLENVQMKKIYLDVISGILGVSPVCINSALVSAQNRVRNYWTNICNLIYPLDKNIHLNDILESGIADRTKSYCIDANYWKGSNLIQYLKKRRRQLIFESVQLDNLISRKLTPIECERLQTLPDNYTAGVSNTQRYKMLGNAWTVDVIAHILKNIE